MTGKSAAFQRKYCWGKGAKTDPVLVTVKSFIFFHNCTHGITNSFK